MAPQIEQDTSKTLPAVRPSFRGNVTYGGLLSASRSASQEAEQIGKNLSDTGKLLENFTLQVMKDTKEDQDKSYVRNVYKKFADDVRNIKEQLQSQKGEDAMGLVKRAQEELDKIKGTYQKSLKNDNQRRLFEPLALSRQISTLDVLGNYERAETLRWKKESAKAMADAVLQDGIANYTDPANAKVTSQQLKIAVDDLLPGATKKEKDLAYRDYMSRYYLGVMEKYAMVDAEAAQTYYNSVKKNMLGTYQLKAESSLKTLVMAQKVEETTQDIIQKSNGDFGVGSKMVEKIKDPALRSRVRKEFTFRRRLAAEEKKQAEQQAFDELDQQLSQIQNTQIAYKMILNSDLPASKQTVLMNVIKARALNGGDTPTDWEVYHKLKLMPTSEFIKVDLQLYKDKLSDREYKQLIDEQSRERRARHLTQSRSLYKMGDDALKSMGFPEDKKDPDTSQKRELFFKEFDRRLNEIPENERTAQKIQSILDDMTREVIFEKHWYGDVKKREFELTPEERRHYEVPFDPNNPPPNVRWDETRQMWIKDENGKLFQWSPE